MFHRAGSLIRPVLRVPPFLLALLLVRGLPAAALQLLRSPASHPSAVPEHADVG